MKKVYLYVIVLLILGAVLLFVFTSMSKNPEGPQGEDNFAIYDAVDNSVDNYLTQIEIDNQEQNIYDAVDNSIEQFLNQ